MYDRTGRTDRTDRQPEPTDHHVTDRPEPNLTQRHNRQARK